jgi:hypothetical protein
MVHGIIMPSKQQQVQEALKAFDPENEESSIRYILERIKPPVFIDENTETGEKLFSVVVEGTGLWLDAFHTHKQALCFVRKHDLFCKD